MKIVGVQIPPPAPWRGTRGHELVDHRLCSMQVTETNADGLKREFTITVPAGELEEEITRRLGEIGRTGRGCPGFRPGKVPMQILRTALRSLGARRGVGEHRSGQLGRGDPRAPICGRLCRQRSTSSRPSEGADLEYKMSLEVLPEIPEPSFADLGIERLVVEVPDEDVDRAIERIAEQQRKSEVVERPAETGDILSSISRGRIGEQEIPGASGKDRQIVLGAGGFIPGFEDQLVGASRRRPPDGPRNLPRRLRGRGYRRQGGGVRGRCEGGARSACRSPSTTNSARRSGSRALPSCARRCGSRCSAIMTRRRVCA